LFDQTLKQNKKRYLLLFGLFVGIMGGILDQSCDQGLREVRNQERSAHPTQRIVYLVSCSERLSECNPIRNGVLHCPGANSKIWRYTGCCHVHRATNSQMTSCTLFSKPRPGHWKTTVHQPGTNSRATGPTGQPDQPGFQEGQPSNRARGCLLPSSGQQGPKEAPGEIQTQG